METLQNVFFLIMIIALIFLFVKTIRYKDQPHQFAIGIWVLCFACFCLCYIWNNAGMWWSTLSSIWS